MHVIHAAVLLLVCSCPLFMYLQVIPRKDLPRIYTMCLPVKDRDGGFYAKDDLGEGDLSLSSGLQDLEVTTKYCFIYIILVPALLGKPHPAPT